MEQKSKGFPTPDAAVLDAAQLSSSSSPTALLQLPQSTLLPLNLSTFPSILPVSVLNHTLLSSLQQQCLPVQEPMILLPASSASPSTSQEILTQLCNTNTKQVQPHAIQQLLLNNSQMPLLLKSALPHSNIGPVLQTPQMNQSVIVLPVSRTANATFQGFGKNDNLDNSSKSGSDEKQENEYKTGGQSVGDISFWKSSKEVAFIENSNAPGVKSSSKAKTRNNAALNSPIPGMNKQKSEIDFDQCSSSSQYTDLSQIISKLPAGWQVVGITDFTQHKESSSLAVPSTSSIPLLLSPETSIPMSEVTSNLSHNLLTTEIKLPYDQPRLVSVNLNSTSSPAVTDTVVSESPANGLTCSVKMDDIPNAHNLTIKTDCELAVKNSVIETSKSIKHINIDGNIHRTFLEEDSSNQSQKLNSAGQIDFVQPALTSSKMSHVSNKADMRENNWTVVGVTALPQIPSANTVTLVQSKISSSELQVHNRENDITLVDSAGPSTILKIPLLPTNVTSEAAESLKTSKKTASKKVVETSQNDQDIPVNSLSSVPVKDLKWTVVGVVGSAVDGSLTSSPNDSQMNVPCVSLTTNKPLNSTVISSPLSESVSSTLNLVKVKEEPISFCTSPEVSSQNLSYINEPLQSELAEEQIKSEKGCNVSVSASEPSVKIDPTEENTSEVNALQNQWKIIGLTPLGGPQVPTVPLVTHPPFSSLPVPFLMTKASSAAVQNQTISCPCSTATGSPFTSSLSLVSPSSSSFPLFTLAGNVDGTSLLSSKSSTTPAGLQNFQGLVQQPNLSQLIQSQLSSYHTPVNMLTVNESDQWNVVGVISGNQMSVLNLSQGTPSVSSPAIFVNNLTNSDPNSAHAEPASFEKSKSMPILSEARIGGRQNTNSKHSLALKLALSGQESAFTKSKNIHSKQENTRMKKNTVSNLLRMKRMQQKAHQNEGSSEDGDQFCEDPLDFSHPVEELPQKKAKIRSLRSYAGNRKLFTKTRPKNVEEKISLRSGTQVPVPHFKSEENESVVSAMTSLQEEEEQPATASLVLQEKANKDVKEIAKLDVHSSARRRKLKVPRKMVADLDYHPFDSSSDSN